MARKVNQETNEYLLQVSKRLKYAITEMDLTQAEVVEKCEKIGFRITKPVLTKLLKEGKGVSLTNIANIASALNLNMNELCSVKMDDINRPIITIPARKREPVFYNESDSEYLKPYKGKYNLIMFRTVSDEPGYITGTLNIEDMGNSNPLKVSIHIKANRNYIPDSIIEKDYVGNGTLKYSPRMHVIYITATDEKTGEDVFIILPYISLLHEPLTCCIGLALVSCSGTNRIPTCERILISKEEISTTDLEQYISSQLLLNDSEIRISEEKFERMKNDERLPESFRKIFIQGEDFAGALRQTYYWINEATIRSCEMPLSDKMKSVCILRQYSDAKRNIKVSSKANELLYKLIKELEAERRSKHTDELNT